MSKPIAFFTHYSKLFGANRSLLALITHLPRKEFDPIVILAKKGPLEEELRKLAINYLVFDSRNWVSSNAKGNGVRSLVRFHIRWLKKKVKALLKNLFVLPSILKELSKRNVGLIYVNSSVNPIGGIAAIILGKPFIWHVREFGDLDYDILYDWGKTIFRLFLSKADKIICISKAVQEYVLGEKIDSEKVEIIFNGVASIEMMDKYFESYENTYNKFIDYKNSPFKFVLVGFFHPAKGQIDAIKAINIVRNSHQNVELDLVGSGSEEYMAACRDLVKELKLEKIVNFRGYMENPYQAYLDSDAVLICSRHEAMGRVTAEAMASCRPLIAFAGGGTLELVKDGFNGLLYKGSFPELAEKMIELIEQPDLRNQLVINGHYYARENFSIENYASSIERVINMII